MAACRIGARKRENKLGKRMLADLRPELAAEWAPQNKQAADEVSVVNLTRLPPKLAWWRCPKHGDWQEDIKARMAGKKCPRCAEAAQGRTTLAFREIVGELAKHVGVLTPMEMYVLVDSVGLLKSQERRELVAAIAEGRIAPAELAAFSRGEPAPMADAIFGGDIEVASSVIDQLDTPLPAASPPGAPAPPEALPVLVGAPLPPVPAAPAPPEVCALRILNAAAFAGARTSAAETIEFIVLSSLARLWGLYLDGEERGESAAALDGVLLQGQNLPGLGGEVARRFTEDRDAALSLPLPPGYTATAPDGTPLRPNTMQRLVCHLMLKRRRLGNWSGTGAGKTLAATLAARTLGSHLTVIICPNAVVGVSEERGPDGRIVSDAKGWRGSIENHFRGTAVATKTWEPGDAEWAVFNFEMFQEAESPELIDRFLETYGAQVGMVIIDEVHMAKRREHQEDSARRTGILRLLEGVPWAARMVMSATPVINDLVEGGALVEMVTGTNPMIGGGGKSILACARLHRALIECGIRWVPKFDITLTQPSLHCAVFSPPPPGTLVFTKINGSSIWKTWAENVLLIDITAERDSLQAFQGTLATEYFLTHFRAPEFLKKIAPDEPVIVYSTFKGGGEDDIFGALLQFMENAGHRVAMYSGDQTDAEKDAAREAFKAGRVNVLLCTEAIATGIDGLQGICSKIIINMLPWTQAQYEQLIGRVARQGQKKHVEVILPLTYYRNDDGTYSSHEADHLKSLLEKKTLADAAVNGAIPDREIVNRKRLGARAQRSADLLLARLAGGAP